MEKEDIPIQTLLDSLNAGKPQAPAQPITGFRKIAVLVYNQGNVKARIHKETDGRHHLPHIHIEMPDGTASISFDGILLAGEFREIVKVSRWVAERKKHLTVIWDEVHKDRPDQSVIDQWKRCL